MWKLSAFDDLKVIKWILIKEFRRWFFYGFCFNHLQNLLDLGWYLEVMHCSVPIMLCNATNFIGKLPSLVINISIHLCQHYLNFIADTMKLSWYFHFFHCFWHWCHFFIDCSVSILMLCYKSLWEIFCILASLPLCEANALDFWLSPNCIWNSLIFIYCVPSKEINPCLIVE